MLINRGLPQREKSCVTDTSAAPHTDVLSRMFSRQSPGETVPVSFFTKPDVDNILPYAKRTTPH